MDIEFKLESKGSTIPVSDYQFKSMSTVYAFNSYPMFTLNLKKVVTVDNSIRNEQKYDFLQFKDLKVDIKSDSLNLKCDIGINNIFTRTLDTIVIQGYLCESKYFSEVNSRYLGDNTKDAIRTLGFKQELAVPNLSRDFFQLSETAISSLNRILLGSGNRSIYTINEDEIRVLKLDELKRNVNSTYWELDPVSIQYDPMFKLSNRATDVSFESNSSELGKGQKIYVSSQYGNYAFSSEASPFNSNLISNMIFQQGLNLVLEMPSSPTDTRKLKVGDIVDMPYNDLPFSKYIVTKLSKTLSQDGFQMTPTLQNFGD